MRVLVRGHLQHQPLVHRTAGEPVQLGSRALEDRDTRVHGAAQRLDLVVGVDALGDAYNAVPGTDARSASTTGLRPAITSGPSPRPESAAAVRFDRRSAAAVGRCSPGRR